MPIFAVQENISHRGRNNLSFVQGESLGNCIWGAIYLIIEGLFSRVPLRQHENWAGVVNELLRERTLVTVQAVLTMQLLGRRHFATGPTRPQAIHCSGFI